MVDEESIYSVGADNIGPRLMGQRLGNSADLGSRTKEGQDQRRDIEVIYLCREWIPRLHFLLELNADFEPVDFLPLPSSWFSAFFSAVSLTFWWSAIKILPLPALQHYFPSFSFSQPLSSWSFPRKNHQVHKLYLVVKYLPLRRYSTCSFFSQPWISG